MNFKTKTKTINTKTRVGLVDISDKEAEKRVYNILTNQLFKLAKVGVKALKNSTPDNQQLVKIIHSEGLQLNNPLL